MTLGCGGSGGNITSDNISPRHLLNIKRLAYELRPATAFRTGPAPSLDDAPSPRSAGPSAPGPLPLPKVAMAPVNSGVDSGTVQQHIAAYVAARTGSAPVPLPSPSAPDSPGPAVPFVCEDDVRAAIRQGRQIPVAERTIITPAARDLGEARRVFVQAGWSS
jgi:acetaldehyde dehydrogenase (acetylating)